MTTFSKAEGKEELKIHHGSRRHTSQTTAGRQTQSQCQICCCLSRWWFSHFLHFKVTPTLRLSALRPLVSKFGNYSLAFTTSCWVQPSHFYDLKKTNNQSKTQMIIVWQKSYQLFLFHSAHWGLPQHLLLMQKSVTRISYDKCNNIFNIVSEYFWNFLPVFKNRVSNDAIWNILWHGLNCCHLGSWATKTYQLISQSFRTSQRISHCRAARQTEIALSVSLTHTHMHTGSLREKC